MLIPEDKCAHREARDVTPDRWRCPDCNTLVEVAKVPTYTAAEVNAIEAKAEAEWGNGYDEGTAHGEAEARLEAERTVLEVEAPLRRLLDLHDGDQRTLTLIREVAEALSAVNPGILPRLDL